MEMFGEDNITVANKFGLLSNFMNYSLQGAMSRILLSLVLSCLVLSCLTFSCSERTTQETEQIISTSPTLRAADRMCSDLRIPDKFRFVKKDVSGNSEYGLVIYLYASDIQAVEAADFYKNYLPSHGWDLVAEWPEEDRVRSYIKFQKNNDFVSVERLGSGELNYAVNCGVKG